MSPSKPRKPPTRVTDDMRHKIAAEYSRARKADKPAIRARYNVSTSAISDWIHKGYGNPSVQSARVESPPADRSLEDLLWAVVIKAREAGEITTVEARRLLELVR